MWKWWLDPDLNRGPGVCGVAGGVATWLAIDATIIGVDEYINRDDFEKELRLLVENQKRDYLSRIKGEINKKEIQYTKTAIKLVLERFQGVNVRTLSRL